MNQPRSVVIAGASAAGVSAARTLRREGYSGQITLHDADPNGSYERPPLSKAILQNPAQTVESIALLSPAEVRELELHVEYGCRVIALDAKARCLTVESGATHSADAILLATGGVARKLPVPGGSLPGVHVLRDFSDAKALRSALAVKRKIAVIGGGLIGAETVASLACQDHEIVWIEALSQPLAHVLPQAICDFVLKNLLSGRVELINDARIAEFVEAGGQVAGIRFEDSREIAADLLVMGVGMTPDIQLAESAGLAIAGGGVRVDEGQRSSAAGIYAAGDLASFECPGDVFHRDEHWQAAEHQGANAARSMLGQEPLPRPVPWFWSDQGDFHIEMAGTRGTESLLRKENGAPVVFEMNAGQLVGAASVNNPSAVRVALRLIRSGAEVDPDELIDPATDLRTLLRR